MGWQEVSDKILIVDDKTTLVMLSTILQGIDCEVITANNGSECFEYVERGEVDLILLDVLMPDISGMEVLRRIREDHLASDLPVVMVTSNQSDKDVVAALSTGANDYITKPINVDIAIARIKGQLDLARFHRESIKTRQMETVQAMITTYNHEINNPLAGAMGFLEMEIKQSNSEKLIKAQRSLMKIAEIVVKIRQLADEEIEFSTYAGGVKMLKVTD